MSIQITSGKLYIGRSEDIVGTIKEALISVSDDGQVFGYDQQEKRKSPLISISQQCTFDCSTVYIHPLFEIYERHERIRLEKEKNLYIPKKVKF